MGPAAARCRLGWSLLPWPAQNCPFPNVLTSHCRSRISVSLRNIGIDPLRGEVVRALPPGRGPLHRPVSRAWCCLGRGADARRLRAVNALPSGPRTGRRTVTHEARATLHPRAMQVARSCSSVARRSNRRAARRAAQEQRSREQLRAQNSMYAVRTRRFERQHDRGQRCHREHARRAKEPLATIIAIMHRFCIS